MKIFATGHQGYIGVHLVDLLRKHGHKVHGCDLGLFDGCAFGQVTPPHSQMNADFRSLKVSDLEGFDAVIHLAAISNDPMGDLDESITASVNGTGTVELASKAKQAGVRRFIFASSCSMYGKGETLDLDETAKLNPVSAYARAKIVAEQGIDALVGDGFSAVHLRNATAYGASPMLRIDIVANNLLASALACNQIRIMSDGEPWRPLVHCYDIASACVAFLEPPVNGSLAVNIGANSENYQVKDVAKIVGDVVPSAKIVFTGEVGHDPRDYRVNFDLLGKVLPDFKLTYTLRSGVEEMHRQMVDAGFSLADFEGDRYVRLRTLRHRLNRLSLS